MPPLVIAPSIIPDVNHADTLEQLSQRCNVVLERLSIQLAEQTKQLRQRESQAENSKLRLSNLIVLPVNIVESADTITTYRYLGSQQGAWLLTLKIPMLTE